MSSDTDTTRYEILPKHERGLRPGLRLLDGFKEQVAVLREHRMGRFGAAVVLGFVLLALFAPYLAPYDVDTKHRGDDGSIKRMEAPSTTHWFGTTNLGYDVFSQTIVSARISLLVGFTAALVSVVIGTAVGIVSAYRGGWVDDVLMRITDVMYGIPFLPFVIVLVIMLGPGLFNIVFAISIIMWRATARVIRSQVLTIKERPYIEAAHAVGTSDFRIMYRHLLPNVLPLTFLYGALNVSFAIIAEASISFLGFGDPTQMSWGKMIFEAYTTGGIRTAWWWAIPPGLAISLLVVSVFLIARAYETVTNPELEVAR